MLTALNNKKRKATGKDTDFLAFEAEYPPGSALLDLRSKSEVERKKRVKNV